MRYLKDYLSMAPNFKYEEFVKSNTAIRKGIPNIPTEEIWQKIELLAEHCIQPIRTHFGPIKINSGFRSPDLNVAIGGSTTSNHCNGEASDIESWTGKIALLDIAEWAFNNLEFRTIIVEYPPQGWIHIDYRKGGNLKRLKLKDATHNYKNVDIEYLRSLLGNI